jgi:inorganic triphosphatase YgiF
MVEIELKYIIPDKNEAENIWQDPDLVKMEETNSREKLPFRASYFDTEDGVLAKNDIAFRVRIEGARTIATLKWNGQSEGALHTREEINVPIDDEACLIMPDPALFKESEIGAQMLSLVAGKQLVNVMEVGFLRRRVRVDTGSSIIEVSIDTGDIITDQGSLPICEVELELFSGSQDELVGLGNKLAERYALVPEELSKYARGLIFANKIPGAE